MLTTQQVEQFNTRGYTVCPCLLSAAQVDALLAETARATQGHTLAEHDAERMEMEPGQASIHHLFMWHASPANVTENRRVALALRYITPKAKQTRTDRDFATLVRGRDDYKNFEYEPIPTSTMAPEALRIHKEIADIQGGIYLKGTDKASIDGLIDRT